MSKQRLIDADALGKRLDNEKWMDNYDRDFIVDVALDEAPTVDAVQVIRCRDCKYSFNRQGRKHLGCYYHGKNGITLHDADDFCSYGERIDGRDK